MIREVKALEPGYAINFDLTRLIETEPIPGPLGHPFTWLEYTHLNLVDRVLLRFEQAGLRATLLEGGRILMCDGPPAARPWEEATNPMPKLVAIHDELMATVAREEGLTTYIEAERASQHCLCQQCGQPYGRHPDHPEAPYLTLLCDGTAVKL
jgi:hypothetical protein